jgi:Cu/Ag efflux pump CusA
MRYGLLRLGRNDEPTSVLSVVNAVHKALETARAAAPPGMQISELFDQSVFVKQSVAGVLSSSRSKTKSGKSYRRTNAA